MKKNAYLTAAIILLCILILPCSALTFEAPVEIEPGAFPTATPALNQDYVLSQTDKDKLFAISEAGYLLKSTFGNPPEYPDTFGGLGSKKDGLLILVTDDSEEVCAEYISRLENAALVSAVDLGGVVVNFRVVKNSMNQLSAIYDGIIGLMKTGKYDIVSVTLAEAHNLINIALSSSADTGLHAKVSELIESVGADEFCVLYEEYIEISPQTFDPASVFALCGMISLGAAYIFRKK